MEHQIFFDCENKKKRYVVITNWGKNKPSESEAIRLAASYVFKCASYKLKCIPVYMAGPNASEFYASKQKGTKKFLAVCRK